MDLTDVQRAKSTLCLCAGSLRQIGLLLPYLTCSVHHHYFGVFLPQEGAEIRAPLAELPLPQTWSRTKRGGGSLEEQNTGTEESTK